MTLLLYHTRTSAALDGLVTAAGPQRWQIRRQQQETREPVVNAHGDESVTLAEEEQREKNPDPDPAPVRPSMHERIAITRQIEEVDGPQLSAPVAWPRVRNRSGLAQQIREHVRPKEDQHPNDKVQDDADEQHHSVSFDLGHSAWWATRRSWSACIVRTRLPSVNEESRVYLLLIRNRRNRSRRSFRIRMQHDVALFRARVCLVAGNQCAQLIGAHAGALEGVGADARTWKLRSADAGK